MLILAPTTDKLQVITGSAGTVNVHCSYLDNVSGAVLPGRQNTNITTAATTDVAVAAAAGIVRNIKTVHIHNHGASSNDITVVHTDGTTAVQLHKQTLPPNGTLQYIDEIGFQLGDLQERMQIRNVTSAYTVLISDRNAIFNLNGTFPLNLPPAAAAGAGFVFRVRNIGYTTVTITPNAGQTIDGFTTLKCCGREEFLVACDGANWITLGRSALVMIGHGANVTGATFSMILPPDYVKFEIELSQVVYGTPGYIGLNINLNGPYATGYYWQRHYSYQGSLFADQALNGTPVQFSGNSSVPTPDFDGKLDLWPDPIVVPRTASFHFMTRTTMFNDGTSAVIEAGGWAAGSTRATQVMFGSTGGPFTQGNWIMRGQIP